MKNYCYYIDKQTPAGTEIYLFSEDFILSISKSFREQHKTTLKSCLNTSKAFENYRNTLLIDSENKNT